MSQWRGRKWWCGAGVALAVLGLGMPTAHGAATPPPSDFVVTTIDAAAGYYQVEGTCPAKTSLVTFTWLGAPNGRGSGAISQGAGPFSLKIRMLAKTADSNITATVRCVRASGRTLAQWGPTTLASGNDLLPVPPDSGSGRRIVYEISAQQLWAIEADGTVARTYLVSGRRKGMLNDLDQVGTFKVEKKIMVWCKHGVCRWFLAFHHATNGWIGLHAIPARGGVQAQKDTELGQPRSGGCVRASRVNAAWMWDWGQVGDTVVVLP